MFVVSNPLVESLDRCLHNSRIKNFSKRNLKSKIGKIQTKSKSGCSKNQCSLKVLNHNVQSLRNKKEELDIFVNEENNQFDVLAFTEHWLNKYEIDLYHLNEYKLISCFCRSLNRNGGSRIFVKNNNSEGCRERSDLSNFSKENCFELSAIEYRLTDNKHTIILCVYRPPSSDVWEFLKRLEEVLSKIRHDRQVIICGDFNIDFLKDTRSKQILLSLLQSHNLYVILLQIFLGPK